LEHLLGEKSFANDISLIDIAQQPSDIEKMKLLNLYNLADYIKNIKKNRNNLIAFGRNSDDKRK
jgi:hypothetical protein